MLVRVLGIEVQKSTQQKPRQIQEQPDKRNGSCPVHCSKPQSKARRRLYWLAECGPCSAHDDGLYKGITLPRSYVYSFPSGTADASSPARSYKLL